MSQIKIRGFVPNTFNGVGCSLRIEDSKEIEQFYVDEKIDTGLRYAGGYPVISISGEIASNCKPGDRVFLTVESNLRGGKIGIRNVEIEII